MVSKCANPACPVSFRYLRDGRLFRFEGEESVPSQTGETISSAKTQARRARFAWLCHQCCSKVKLVVRSDGIFTEPLARAQAASASS